MDLPNLQKEIEKRAENKLEEDIKNLSEEWKNWIPPILRNVSISINGKNSDGSSYQSRPFIFQLFDTTPVRVAIKERYLSEYIQRDRIYFQERLTDDVSVTETGLITRS